MKKERLLEELFEIRINNALEQELVTNEDYRESSRLLGKKSDKLDRMKFSKKQWTTVDKVISATNVSGAVYGKVAYKQGFYDALKLMEELKNII